MMIECAFTLALAELVGLSEPGRALSAAETATLPGGESRFQSRRNMPISDP
jgi:hypothetical protein